MNGVEGEAKGENKEIWEISILNVIIFRLYIYLVSSWHFEEQQEFDDKELGD